VVWQVHIKAWGTIKEIQRLDWDRVRLAKIIGWSWLIEVAISRKELHEVELEFPGNFL